MKRRGVTLIELVIAIAIVGLLSLAITRAFVAGIDYETKISAARERIEARDRIDDRLTNLFHHAYLSPNDTETNTFFIALYKAIHSAIDQQYSIYRQMI